MSTVGESQHYRLPNKNIWNLLRFSRHKSYKAEFFFGPHYSYCINSLLGLESEKWIFVLIWIGDVCWAYINKLLNWKDLSKLLVTSRKCNWNENTMITDQYTRISRLNTSLQFHYLIQQNLQSKSKQISDQF